MRQAVGEVGEVSENPNASLGAYAYMPNLKLIHNLTNSYYRKTRAREYVAKFQSWNGADH
jgi:hypothetical protein